MNNQKKYSLYSLWKFVVLLSAAALTSSSQATGFSSIFPFSASLGQIAYMSCSDMSASTDGEYFGLHMSAYDRDGSHSYGLKFSEEFANGYSQLSGSVRSQAIIDKITKDKSLIGLRLQLGIHRQGLLGEFESQWLGYPLKGKFLSTQPVTYPLSVLSKDQSLSYFSNFSSQDSTLETFLNFNTLTLGGLESLKSRFNGQVFLTLAYNRAESGFEGGVLDSSGNFARADKALGRAYKLLFKDGNKPLQSWPNFILKNTTTTYTMEKNKVLSSVTELDLNTLTPVTDTSWDCPEDFQFMMVRAIDIDNNLGQAAQHQFCPRVVHNPKKLTARQEAVFRSLYAENWYVNFEYRCVTPITNQASSSAADKCYDAVALAAVGTEANYVVDYHGTLSASQEGRCGYTDPNGNAVLCPEYVSFCFSK